MQKKTIGNLKCQLISAALLAILPILIACTQGTNNIENTITNIDKNIPLIKGENIALLGEKFLNYFKNGEKLSPLFCDQWTLIYHEDNRCQGSTDGRVDSLHPTDIDSIVMLQIINDGEGWLGIMCDSVAPETYTLNFSLVEKMKDWDRYETQSSNDHVSNSLYILGGGESEYLKIYVNDQGLITILEYRSEDPG